MNTAEPQEKPIEVLFENVENYGKTSIELTKLKFLQSMIKIVTSLVSNIAVTLMFSVFVLVLNIGIALYLGELLEKAYYGFFIVSGFYLLLGIILYFFLYDTIKKPISDLIIKQTLKDNS